MTGAFRQRYNKSEFEFKVDKMMLLESIKPHLTRQLVVDVEARYLDDQIVQFIERNVKKYPGKSAIKFNISEPRINCRISMYSLENGFEMNDEMAAFLHERPELEVQVITA